MLIWLLSFIASSLSPLFKSFIKRLGDVIEDKTLIVISHKMSILSLVDRVIVLDDGNVVADGSKEEVFRIKNTCRFYP